MFGTLPYALFFALLFMTPFDGSDQPVPLLLYFIITLGLFETLATLVQTAYYALLPEMFRDYHARTDVAVRMNIFMTVGLLIGTALPAILADVLGWSLMAVIFGVITAAALFFSLPSMFEYKQSLQAESVGFLEAVRATFVNRSFVTVVIAQNDASFCYGHPGCGDDVLYEIHIGG